MKFRILCLAFLFFCFTAAGQEFKNLTFRQLCDSSKTGLCHWALSWGGKGAVQPALKDGKHSLLLQGKSETSVSFTEQTALAKPTTSLRILTVSATIKSDSIAGKGAGLNIGLYDQTGRLLANKDMGGYYSLDWIRGTTGWKSYSISVICPKETAKIKIGAILYGKGKAWLRDYKVAVTSIENRKPSKLALEYLNAACDTIKRNSLVRDSINITALKETALQIAGPARKHSDCYLAVSFLLESLRPYGDEHSFFMTAEEVKNWKQEGSQVSKIQFPVSRLEERCGYLTVPAFHGGNQQQILAFADSLQQAIKRLSAAGIKGWIIDLRQNTGGNMAPMVAGLGPLFSSEKLGALVDVNGKADAWYYQNGRYYWDADSGFTVPRPVTLRARLPIAVLTGNQTGSSGEAVAVSFIGNERTKSFGNATWGLTTGNGSFDLKDGSQIYLASTIMADRTGKQYTGSIAPDFVIDSKGTPENDKVLEAAVKWISAQKE